MSFQLLQDFLLQVAGEHKLVEVYLNYNPHNSSYRTVLEDHEDKVRNWTNPPTWVSKHQMLEAFALNTCWDLMVSVLDEEKEPKGLDTENILSCRSSNLLALFFYVLGRELTLDEVSALEAVTESAKSLLHGKYASFSVSMKTYSTFIQCGEKRSDSVRVIQNAEQLMGDTSMFDCLEDWIGDDELWKKADQALAIKNNRLWNVTVYPNTPVGFYDYYGSGLEVILTPILNAEKEDQQ